MKRTFLPAIIIVIVLWSCASAYRNTSTPDDVYYSPARATKAKPVDEYSSNSEDNYLRMKAHDRYLWDAIDDYAYWNDARYDFGYSCSPSREVMLNPYNPYMGIGFGMYYSPWYNWNSPYTTVVYYKNPKVYYGNTNKSYLTAYKISPYNNTNNKPTFGSLFKQAFSNSNNNTYTPYNNNSSTRTFSSGTMTSGSAGGMSGGFHSTGSSAGGGRGPR
jgi:uncharacterized membrane protein YgcG